MTDSHVEPIRASGDAQPGSVTSSLLDRLRANSPEAWRRLVRLFGPLVYQWCRQNGLQPADATDVGQETFQAVATNIGTFRREEPGDTFRGWLWTITRSKIVDHWRRTHQQAQASGGSTAQSRLENVAAPHSSHTGEPPDPETPGSLYQRALQVIQEDFEEPTWRAFWRVAVDGCTPADVAGELNISVNAVYLAKSRVLRRLREELGDLLDEAR